MAYDALHRVYLTMRARCSNPKNRSYPDYGARGIDVSKDWGTFAAFESDMRPSYQHGLTLERIDNDKGYCKDNCRWATRKEQARNRRSNHPITFKGKTALLIEWAEILGIKSSTIKQRFYVYKWPIERVLTK